MSVGVIRTNVEARAVTHHYSVWSCKCTAQSLTSGLFSKQRTERRDVAPKIYFWRPARRVFPFFLHRRHPHTPFTIICVSALSKFKCIPLLLSPPLLGSPLYCTAHKHTKADTKSPTPTGQRNTQNEGILYGGYKVQGTHPPMQSTEYKQSSYVRNKKKGFKPPITARQHVEHVRVVDRRRRVGLHFQGCRRFCCCRCLLGHYRCRFGCR